MTEALAAVGSVVTDTSATPRNAHQLPDPKGYKILIAMPEPDEKTEGGIIKSKVTLHIEERRLYCNESLLRYSVFGSRQGIQVNKR